MMRLRHNCGFAVVTDKDRYTDSELSRRNLRSVTHWRLYFRQSRSSYMEDIPLDVECRSGKQAARVVYIFSDNLG